MKNRHACPVCRNNDTNTSICAICASDVTELGIELPSPDATPDEVKEWVKQNKIFSCKNMPD